MSDDPGAVLTTARLRLVPGTLELIAAEFESHEGLGRALEVAIPSDLAAGVLRP